MSFELRNAARSPESTGAISLALLSTVTVSLAVPIARAMPFTLRTSPGLTVIPVCCQPRNPCAAVGTVYAPGSRLAKAKEPVAFLSTTRASFEPSFTDGTLAPVVLAPVAATLPMQPQLALDAVARLRIAAADVPARPLSLRGMASVDGVPGEFVQALVLD